MTLEFHKSTLLGGPMGLQALGAQAVTSTAAHNKQEKQRARSEGQAVFGPSWFKDEPLRHWFLDQHDEYERQLEFLRVAAKSGGGISKARDHALRSRSGRVRSIVRAFAKRGAQATRVEIEALANELRPWRNPDEPIRVHLALRDDGKKRFVLSPGLKRLSMNYLALDVLSATWGNPEDEYNWKGRGTNELVRLLRYAIENGNPCVGHADVKNCFPSFRHDWVFCSLPLPESVIRNSILIPKGTSLVDSHGDEVGGSARNSLQLGLPQGFPTSSLIASWALSATVNDLGFDNFFCRYSDNLVWAAFSEIEADKILKSLNERFSAHPAGELTLHDAKIVALEGEEGIDILGYRIRLRPEFEACWRTIAFPNARSFRRLEERIYRKLADHPQSGWDDIALAATGQWISAFREWSPSSTRRDIVFGQALGVAEKRRKDVSGFDPSNLNSMADAWTMDWADSAPSTHGSASVPPL